MTVDGKSYVYALIDPRSGELRYIGKTCRDVAARVSSHMSSARNGSPYHSAYWLRQLIKAGMVPDTMILAHAPHADVANLERRYIALLRDVGAKLTNMADGGEGSPGINKGRKHTLEARRNMSNAQTGRKHTAATRRKIGLANSGRIHSCEARQKMAKSSTGKKHSAATRAKIGVASSGRKISAKTRKKLSENAKRQWSDPDSRRALCAGVKRSWTKSSRREKVPSKRAPRTPEWSRKISEALRAQSAELSARAQIRSRGSDGRFLSETSPARKR